MSKKNFRRYLSKRSKLLNLTKKLCFYPHNALQGVLVEKLPLLGGFLEPEDKPGAGDPVGVELVARYGLK